MQLPSVIEKYWYGFDWDVEALWALDLPVSQMPIRRLEWMLDIPAFGFEGKRHALTPRDILKSPYRYAEEYARAQRASLVFPLDITWHRGRWLILDGVHRLMKAHELRLEEVSVRKVPKKHLIAVGKKT
jgi:hypothetical protein